MAKRIKRAEKSKESLIRQIDKHFEKIEEDIGKNDLEAGRYHIKETKNSHLVQLRRKLDILGESDEIVEKYEKRLEELEEKIKNGENVV